MATTAPATVTPGPLARITDALSSQMPHITKLLPPDIALEQFRAATWLEMRQSYGLFECSPESVVAAVIKAATYGLLPGRDCHLLPFANSRRGGKKEATFVPSYQGLILSLERSGKLRKAFAHPVYERDVFELDYLTDIYSHKPYIKGHAGELLCFYGCVMLKDGVTHLEVMSLDQINAIRMKAPGHKDGPWQTHYEEMARKTALKRVAKYVRLSPTQVALLEEDDQREQQESGDRRFQTTVSDLYGGERPIMAQVSGAGGAARVIPEMSQVPDLSQLPRLADEAIRQMQDTDKAIRQMQDTPFEAPSMARKAPVPADLSEGQFDVPSPAPGDAEAKQDTLPAVVMTSLEGLVAIQQSLKDLGWSAGEVEVYWQKTCKRCRVAIPEQIPARWLPLLLDEAQQMAAQVAHLAPASDWRQVLTAVQGGIQDGALLEEIFNALDDPGTPDDVGEQVLTRAQAWVAQAGAGEGE